MRFDRLDWEIEILSSEPEVAAPLGVRPGMLVVASRATAYADDGVPVSRSVRCDRIDRAKFHVAPRYSPEIAPRGVSATPRRGRGTKGASA
jgi:DNA-binding GntR family transcriptional regulator